MPARSPFSGSTPTHIKGQAQGVSSERRMKGSLKVGPFSCCLPHSTFPANLDPPALLRLIFLYSNGWTVRVQLSLYPDLSSTFSLFLSFLSKAYRG
jgi:hypothetical protein